MEDHPGHVTTTDRNRNLQRGRRQRGVVVGAHREPDRPARVQVQDSREVERPLLAGDLSQVTDCSPGDGQGRCAVLDMWVPGL